jgi:putative intracellular protease/amidase
MKIHDLILRIVSTCMLIFLFANAFGQKQRFKVAVFIYEEAEILDFAGPTEVFAATDGFEVYTVSADGQQLSTRPGGVVKVKPDYSLDNAPTPDIIIIPGGNSRNPAARGQKLFQWIKNNRSYGAVVMTVCSGASIVAETGLFDGLRISTNYQIIENLRKKYPQIDVLEDARFVDNGHILTTAGVSAGIDGALHMVSRIKGLEVAKATARYMEYDKWNPEDGKIDHVNPNIDKIMAGLAPDQLEPIPFEGELINEGGHQFRIGNYNSTINLLVASVKWYPYSFNSYRDLAAAYKAQGREVPIDESDYLTILNQKDFVNANRVFGDTREKFPGWLIFSEQSIYDTGHKFLNTGDVKAALEVFKIYVQAFPKSWYSFDSLAAAWAKLGNKKEAIVNYKKVLELNADNEGARKALADLGM